ncbi:MAG: hypothetical protein ACFFHV_08350 [Promethearchaeota archaeon]
MRAITYLNPRYKKIGTSLVTVLVIINVDPHKIEVIINNRIARIFFSEWEMATIIKMRHQYFLW